MQINEISTVLDAKLAQLELRLNDLHQRKQQAQNPEQQLALERDINALTQVRRKLLKSKDLAWRAHNLQHNQEDQQRARQRRIGLSLCGLSLIGAGLLLSYALLS